MIEKNISAQIRTHLSPSEDEPLSTLSFGTFRLSTKGGLVILMQAWDFVSCIRDLLGIQRDATTVDPQRDGTTVFFYLVCRCSIARIQQLPVFGRMVFATSTARQKLRQTVKPGNLALLSETFVVPNFGQTSDKRWTKSK